MVSESEVSKLQKANDFNVDEGVDVEMMSDSTMNKLIKYLRSIGWSESQIVTLLEYITSK